MLCTLIEEHQPDILLLDLKMPGLDGLAILQKLQSSNTQHQGHCADGVRRQERVRAGDEAGHCGHRAEADATELLIKSIRKVHAGEIWLDSHTTAAVMRQFCHRRR